MDYAIPDEAWWRLTALRAGIMALVPTYVILNAWYEHLKAHEISLRDCADEITRRALWYICILAAIVFTVYVCSPGLFEACWNYANGGYSAAPALGMFGGLAVHGLLWFACWYFPAQGVVLKMAGAVASKYLRGSLVIDGSANQAQDAKSRADIERDKKPGQYIGDIVLGGLCMPPSDEMLHTLIIGATGSGKSVAIRGSIVTIAERAKYTGERMIIADPDGGYPVT
jgi:hypothetical protein